MDDYKVMREYVVKLLKSIVESIETGESQPTYFSESSDMDFGVLRNTYKFGVIRKVINEDS